MSVQKHVIHSIAIFVEAVYVDVSSLDVIVAFRKSTLVTNKISVAVKSVNFVMSNVYNLCKNQMVYVNVEFFDGRLNPCGYIQN